MMQFFFKHF